MAAAQADLAGTLRGYAAQGVDASTATRLTAGSFASNTSHTPEACSWVVTELAMALGMGLAAQPGYPAAGGNPLVQPTMQAPESGRPTFTPAGSAAPQPTYVAGGQPQPNAGAAYPAWQPGWPAPGQSAPGQQAQAGPAGPKPVAGGIAGLIGAVLLLLGCAVPFVKFSGQAAVSLFSGYNGAPTSETFWFAIEPGGVMAIALVISILLLVRGRPRTLAAGMLIAFGIQTVFLFCGWVFVVYSPSKREAGGVLGLLAGVVLVLAGVLCLTANKAGSAGQAQQAPVSPY